MQILGGLHLYFIMKNFLIAIILLAHLPICSIAQTKWINHISNGGTIENFVQAYNDDLYNNSNLGMAPTRLVEHASLDSLIFVNDTTCVMVTSKCYKLYNKHYSTNETIDEDNYWKPGKDTIRHHPLFTQQYNLNLIKETLKKTYNFKNNINKVKFVNYFTKAPAKQNLPLPVMDTIGKNNNTQNPKPDTYIPIQATPYQPKDTIPTNRQQQPTLRQVDSNKQICPNNKQLPQKGASNVLFIFIMASAIVSSAFGLVLKSNK
jgi:hypothetical protein